MTAKYFCEELFPCTDLAFNIAEKCVKNQFMEAYVHSK